MITGIKNFYSRQTGSYGDPGLFLLLGTGCYLMLSLRFLPLKNLPAALRRVFCQKAGREQRAGEYLRFLP